MFYLLLLGSFCIFFSPASGSDFGLFEFFVYFSFYLIKIK